MTHAAPAPNIHPTERLTTPSGRQADIDSELVDLVRRLWAMGLDTVACCQDFGEGVAGQRGLALRSGSGGQDGFIEYYTGFAWLKMPLQDGQTLANTLLDTPFRERVSVRWQPESWRMHVPLVYESGPGITLANAAQIHFPHSQIHELTTVLDGLG